MIVCIGDSITAGQLLPDPAKAWPRLLLDNVMAAGVPGDTTRLGLERFPRDVQAYTADIVVIQFGHNDANRWLTDRGLPRVSLAAYVANLEEMVERCRTFGAVPVLCTLTPSLRSAQHAADCGVYDSALRGLSVRRNVLLADTGAAIRPAHMVDGLHLNEAGHLAYADAVLAALP